MFFQVFWILVFVVLGGFVEFGEATARDVGCGGGKKGSTTSSRTILELKPNNYKVPLQYDKNSKQV